jgi:hypothetical protein
MITVTYFLTTSHVDGYFSLATRVGGRDVFQSSSVEREHNERQEPHPLKGVSLREQAEPDQTQPIRGSVRGE